jgi:putative ABC transport system substrate-binding protein
MRLIGLAVVLLLSLFVAPRAAGAQEPRVYQVGLVSIGSAPDSVRNPLWQAFVEAMRQANYVEGRNLVVKHAFAGGQPDRLADLVAGLVRTKVDVIVTTSTRETLMAKRATSQIPIVMTLTPDPVGQGLVGSLARPGGNVTGLTSLVPGLSQKYVELLREMTPSASRFAVVTGPPNPIPEIRTDLQVAARQLGLALSFTPVKTPDEFDEILASARKQGARGVVVPLDAVTYLHRKAFVQVVLKHRLPAIYWARDYVEDGGLMAYSASLTELGRQAATFVDKILKGARPADLPIQQPTKFDLVINLKTAKALGLTIPQTLLLRADHVIE